MHGACVPAVFETRGARFIKNPVIASMSDMSSFTSRPTEPLSGSSSPASAPVLPSRGPAGRARGEEFRTTWEKQTLAPGAAASGTHGDAEGLPTHGGYVPFVPPAATADGARLEAALAAPPVQWGGAGVSPSQVSAVAGMRGSGVPECSFSMYQDLELASRRSSSCRAS